MRTLFLILGLVLLLRPFNLLAAEPLSPWVRAVIERSTQGISTANGLDTTNCVDDVMKAAYNNLQGALAQSTDVLTDLSTEAQLLTERTVCFESDRVLLKKKMLEVALAAATATQECKRDKANALIENYRFLTEAYTDLVRGGADPSYPSTLLRFDWRFHDRGLWDARTFKRAKNIEDVPVPEQCPFTSDYGAHSIVQAPGTEEPRSAGCDSSVLETIEDPLKREAEILRDFSNLLRTTSVSLRETVDRARASLDRIGSRSSSSSSSSSIPSAPPHIVVSGCVKPAEPSSPTPAEIEALLLSYPDFFEESHLGEMFGFGGPPENRLPRGLLFRPLTDYFSLSTAHIAIVRAFGQMRDAADERRPLPAYFLPTANDSFWSYIQRVFVTEQELRAVSENIEQQMTFLDTVKRDALERMDDQSDDLKDAVRRFANVSANTIPIQYVPRLTYFLARSCVDGHCQGTLQSVTKRTFNPYCRPYYSGKYDEEDVYKKCFCAPSIQSSWSEWNRYCSDNLDGGPSGSRRDEIAPYCAEPNTDAG
ncbi:MAG: hypothetical protein ABL890_03630 [Candidatus Peribacteraceae bacterium]